MAYLHCIPAVTVNDNFGSDPNKGIPGYSKGRQNTILSVVDVGSQPSNTNKSSRNGGHHAAREARRSAIQRGKGFPPSTPSSRVQLQQRKSQSTEEWVSNVTKSSKVIPAPETKHGEKITRKSGSASSVEKVYKPTLPKYCFSASTYQNVLTDCGVVGDLAQLPPPRHTLMTRELPYVYRFKIQQGITSLNNMIPTKRLHTSEQIW